MAFIFNKIAEVVENTVMNNCTFENDTEYQVTIVDHDNTRRLRPHTSQGNYLLPGFSVDLIMLLPFGEEKKINFPSSAFEGRTHKISKIFQEHIMKIEIKVIKAFSRWEFVYNHTGGYEEKMSSKMVTKSSWQTMKETGYEAEAKIGGMIKAVELSASFKHYTKLTRTDAFEKEITTSNERTLKDRCYFWQEMIVVKTNQREPYDELVIPTAHTEKTTDQREPSKALLIYCK